MMEKSWTVNSFCVTSDKMGTKNFSILFLGVPIAEIMDLNGVNLFLRGSCALADPSTVSGFETAGLL